MVHTVLVTGAAGFVGGHLLDLLVQHEARVEAWTKPGGSGARPDVTRPARAGDQIHWHAIDLLDRRSVAAAIAALRPSAIYHCAGATHVGKSWDNTHDTLETNVRGTHWLIEAVRQAAVRARILIPGSALVYRPSTGALTEDRPLGPNSPYAVSKLAQERLGARFAEEDGQPVLIARSFNHVGPGQASSFAISSFARRIAEIEAGRTDPTISVGNLAAQRDLTDVRDTVRAYEVLMQRGVPGRVYNVCSGRTYAIREMLDSLLAEARVPITVRISPSRLRPHDTPRLLGSNQRIREELGWTPQIPIARTLHDLLEYWRRSVG